MSVITAPGFTRHIGTAIISGGAAGAHALPGGGPLDTGDDLLSVRHVSADLVTNADLTAEFSITGSNTIDNTAGTDTTGDFLVVTWAEANV